jgi:hypothetical protein
VLEELRDAIPSEEILSSASDFLIEDAAVLSGTSEAARALLTLSNPRERIRHIARQFVRPFHSKPDTVKPQGAQRLTMVTAVPMRAYGLFRRHGGWLWRASREAESPLRDAAKKRNTLAEWIRDR